MTTRGIGSATTARAASVIPSSSRTAVGRTPRGTPTDPEKLPFHECLKAQIWRFLRKASGTGDQELRRQGILAGRFASFGKTNMAFTVHFGVRRRVPKARAGFHNFRYDMAVTVTATMASWV